MFTVVHRTYTIVFMTCSALFLLSALVLPELARSQEEIQEQEEAASISVDGTSQESLGRDDSESLSGLYTTESIPGDGAVVGDFVVGPGKTDLVIRQGETQTVEITVTNRTGERRRFNLSVEDMQGSQDSVQSLVLLGSDRGPYSVRDYISMPHTSFELDHNQRARIPVTIRVPVDAEAGGLYGSVLVDTVAIEAKPGNTGGAVPQSAIIARIGTLFFVTVPGDVKKEGGLVNFETIPKQTFFQGGPVNFGILFENRGAIHLAPYGELRITNVFDEEIGFTKLEPWFVLPQGLRLREVSWDNKFLFGRYTATVYVNRSYDDVIDEKSYTFWVLPWKPLVAGFVAVFFIIFCIRAFFKKFEFKRKS